MNLLLGQQFVFTPTWLGSFVFEASALHHTESRNGDLGFALAFPFSSTGSTITGFETFGDNQFVSPITAFPVLRNQQKYQFHYGVSHSMGKHAPRFGVNFIHEPVLTGALAGNAETLIQYPENPSFYAADPSTFYNDLTCNEPVSDGISCTATPAANGNFVQNVQRLGFYAEDSWRITGRLTLNYGLRYDTTWGLFAASGRSQLDNPAYLTLKALDIPLVTSTPQDYRHAFAPRIGIAYSPGQSGSTVIRAGFGLYYNDLAQTGWVTAFQAVNTPPGPCVVPTDSGCLPPGSAGALIDGDYKTPYAIHITAGFEHAFNPNWSMSADYTHEQGNHGYRRYDYTAGVNLPAAAPDIALFKSDNRSSYNGLSIHLQGNVSRRLNLIANYTLSSAQTWGCVLGELFDYVNGVCNPLDPFAPGDYGPSGEDARSRFVFAGVFNLPAGFQGLPARPGRNRPPLHHHQYRWHGSLVVNGVKTSLDEFRGTPYIQWDRPRQPSLHVP